MSSNPYRIILADDHHLIRLGIRKLIEEEPGLRVVAEASDGEELIQKAGQIKHDLVITDLAMPGLSGFRAIERIREQNPESRILILSMHKERDFFQQALKMKVDGYVLKEDIFEQMLSAIHTIQRGGQSFSPKLSSGLFEEEDTHKKDSRLVYEILTRREREILELVARGHSNRQIAEDLDISIRTVETHRSNIMKKMDFENVQNLVQFALEHGII